MSGLQIALRIILSLILCAVVFVVAAFFALIAALSGSSFFPPFLMISALVLWVWIFITVFQVFRVKKNLIGWGVLFLIIATPCIISIAYSAYKNSVPELSDYGVNVALYEPFAEDTLAVSLDEPSSYTLSEDLPILDGATALYPLYSAFARAVYPEGDYPSSDYYYYSRTAFPEENHPEYTSAVRWSSTTGSYQKVVDGEVDIIFVAGPSEEQLAYAEENGVELVFTPIGREAFVFFVNKRNSTEGVSSDELRRIYTGELKNWADVRGPNMKIRAFQRPEGSGSQSAFLRFMGELTPMAPPMEDRIEGMGGIIEATADYKNYKGALGYSFLFFTKEMIGNNEIKLIKIDGVYPDKLSAADSSYPLVSDFYAVRAKNNPNPHTEELIEWILSSEGQTLVEKTGYFPVN